MGPNEFDADHDARFLPRQPQPDDRHWTWRCLIRLAEMRADCPDGWYAIGWYAISAEGYGACRDTLRSLGLVADA